MGKASTSFKPGISGNPSGRPPGLSPRARFRKMIDPDLPGLVQTLMQAAQRGDVAAIRVILDRTIPSLKPTADGLLIKTKATATLAERGEAIIAAMSTGTATPDQAKTALETLTAQARLVEQSEIIKRLDSLESLLCLRAKP